MLTIKRGVSEILGSLLLAMIVLGALGWLLTQWQQGVGRSTAQLKGLTQQAELSTLRIDCTGNYIVSIDPTVPSVTDLSKDPAYSNVTYCDAELTAPSYRAYLVVQLSCDGKPLSYFIYGNFTRVIVNGIALYQFHPLSSSSLDPKVPCTSFTFYPYAYLHIVMPSGLEKLALCFVNLTSTQWTVVSCVGV
ncbi:hypothetical protein IPA_02370 [Ignicoccus pacificus DSM 13166]|uniref:Uncharacterized protein n=1 Tax=Ignicoccus pacificus DSM 13166 TaxID=940294 RepID=A0A977KAN8_9CREN|nr:hypothetical protein IPA_02370 [Ignicoccus pacificus DSM 13166]